MNKHPEQWAAMLRRPGSSWGFCVLLKDTSVVVLKEDTPPTNNPCRTWDSNPQPSAYKSDSLSIRPRLPHVIHIHILIAHYLGCSSVTESPEMDINMWFEQVLVWPDSAAVIVFGWRSDLTTEPQTASDQHRLWPLWPETHLQRETHGHMKSD